MYIYYVIHDELWKRQSKREDKENRSCFYWRKKHGKSSRDKIDEITLLGVRELELPWYNKKTGDNVL